MIDQSLLTSDPQLGKYPTPISIERPINDITAYISGHRPLLTVTHTAVFLASLAWARFSMRFVPFRRIARRIEARNRPPSDTGVPFDFKRACRLHYVYTHINPSFSVRRVHAYWTL